ncbi:MAG TPA: hypothetical protein PLT00_15795 [Verrucomicrobiota bacterium]|jgi:hypothetical protein|nr:hypothetical protein [Verrucomicrobiota bacterium]OQB94282.1 MAG: hypothetical protein BWX84_00267 [Verrucomicrobia bacterium ADurb.Bin118]HPY32015.1 hypothetical protein [Verrucomicrobiota bacterium]HQB18160.1 hypothetical protein [Verrucomicrobiota bacterium]
MARHRQVKLTESKLRSIVEGGMTEMGLLDRQATPDEIVKIVQAVLAEAEGRKAKPLAPKLVVPEEPDEQSAKAALFAVCRLRYLESCLNDIPSCECWSIPRLPTPMMCIEATFARQDQVRDVLSAFGVCPVQRIQPPRHSSRPNSCRFFLKLPLPVDWRVPLPQWEGPARA